MSLTPLSKLSLAGVLMKQADQAPAVSQAIMDSAKETRTGGDPNFAKQIADQNAATTAEAGQVAAKAQAPAAAHPNAFNLKGEPVVDTTSGFDKPNSLCAEAKFAIAGLLVKHAMQAVAPMAAKGFNAAQQALIPVGEAAGQAYARAFPDTKPAYNPAIQTTPPTVPETPAQSAQRGTGELISQQAQKTPTTPPPAPPAPSPAPAPAPPSKLLQGIGGGMGGPLNFNKQQSLSPMTKLAVAGHVMQYARPDVFSKQAMTAAAEVGVPIAAKVLGAAGEALPGVASKMKGLVGLGDEAAEVVGKGMGEAAEAVGKGSAPAWEATATAGNAARPGAREYLGAMGNTAVADMQRAWAYPTKLLGGGLQAASAPGGWGHSLGTKLLGKGTQWGENAANRLSQARNVIARGAPLSPEAEVTVQRFVRQQAAKLEAKGVTPTTEMLSNFEHAARKQLSGGRGLAGNYNGLTKAVRGAGGAYNWANRGVATTAGVGLVGTQLATSGLLDKIPGVGGALSTASDYGVYGPAVGAFQLAGKALDPGAQYGADQAKNMMIQKSPAMMQQLLAQMPVMARLQYAMNPEAFNKVITPELMQVLMAQAQQTA
jgi:hypothetical protein